jgi:flavin reductase (DIM6/NTAB) family NADH-FMN oxidoreductase RutF
MEASDLVKPPRVAESPVQLECKVLEVKPLGTQGGAGNLVICEVIKVHVKEAVLDENGRIDPYKIDQVSRLGGDWYSRSNAGLFVEDHTTVSGTVQVWHYAVDYSIMVKVG